MLFCGRMPADVPHGALPPTGRTSSRRPSLAPKITSDGSLRNTDVAERKSFSAYASKRDRTQTDAKKRERTQRLSARGRSRVGVFGPASRNPNRHGLFLRNSHQANNLAFANSIIGSHPFASVCGFCKCNDTRNDTRCGGFPKFSSQRIFGVRARRHS